MQFKKITMYTANFTQMLYFYETVLCFHLLATTATSFTFEAGETVVTFTETTDKTQPFYHFAFDIPSNQFVEAKQWLTKRVALLTEHDKDEVYFETIDAKSLYFEDPAGNIVEFICRFSDAVPNKQSFTATAIQKVSEMSLVVPDKLAVVNTLKAHAIIDRNRNDISANGLTFLGERQDATYLLFVGQGRTWFFSTKKAVVHPLQINLANQQQITINEAGELNIV